MTDFITHEVYNVNLDFKKTLSGDLPEKLSNALEEHVNSVSITNRDSADGDDWVVAITTLGEPDIDNIYDQVESVESGIIDKKDITFVKAPEINWLEHVYESFPPITIGKFFIYGSYYEEKIPEGLIPLQIDAATAFGSGEHETTRGCIQAFDYLLKQGCDFKNALDMGCGSGILAIALTKLLPNIKVTAVDIDPESIVVTERHAELNKVSDKIVSQAGDGYNAPLASENAPYDIIAANILAGPLVEMAPQLAEVLESQGYCVLSGLLTRQKDEVVKAHEAQGLKLIHAEEIGEWQALVMQKI